MTKLPFTKICTCLVLLSFTGSSAYAQINIGKIKDKANKAITNSTNTNSGNGSAVNTSSGTPILNSGKDPFTGTGNTIVTLAGAGSSSEMGLKDAKGTEALFQYPESITTDENGNIYVADKNNHCIRKITAAGEVSTFAGSGERGTVNGVGKEAGFDQPFYIWYDGEKNFYVVENNNTVRRINKEGKVTTPVKASNYPGYVDGEIGDANFDGIKSVVCNSKGEIFILDANNNCIRKLSDGVVSTFAGNKKASLQYETEVKDGPAANATFWNLKFMIIDKSDNIYVCDAPQRIRKINQEGIVSTLPFDVLIKNTKRTFEMDDGNFHGVRDVGVFSEMALTQNGKFLISNEKGCIYEVSEDIKTIRFVYTGIYCNSHNASDYRGITEVADGEDCKGCIGSDKAKQLTVSKEGKIYFTDQPFHCIREIKVKN